MFEKSSGWLCLEPEIRARVSSEAERALARRSRSGAMVYFVVAVVLSLSTPIFRDHSSVLVIVMSLCLVLGISRTIAATILLKETPAPGSLTRIVFYGSTHATVALWGLFCAWTLYVYPLEWTAMFLLLISAALAAGASSSLAPSVRLASLGLLLLVGPTIIAAGFLGGRRGWALAGVASLYLGFLIMQAESTWRLLWYANAGAERERQRGTADRIRAEEERSKLVGAIEQAAEEIVITDIEGKIQYCNPFFEQASGYSRAEVIGRNPRFLKSGKHDVAFYGVLWNTVLSASVWSGRLINKKKNGSLYELDGTISPIRDAAGKITGFVSARHDVTSRIQMEAQLRQAQKMESIARLAAGIAHDFNNLLMIIQGYTELLEGTFPDHDARRGDTREIAGAVDRGAQLTGHLLAFSRKQSVSPVVLNLNVVISETVKMLERVLGEDIDFRVNLAEALWAIQADADQIGQILLNLCVNARDAMPRGGSLIITTDNVALRAEGVSGNEPVPSGEYVRMSVADSGTGMSPEVQEKIFEPFFTTKEAGKGTGLGLATVYGIVKQGNGYVWVESKPGQGTCFTIYWPRTREAIPCRAATQVAEMQPGGGLETVLIAEDEAPLREAMRRLLMSLGYTVFTAGSGDEALAVAGQYGGAIHLLITDVVMARMSGMELSRSLGSLQAGLKTIYMSGHTDDLVLEYGVQDSKELFLRKPFSLDSLASKVQHALEGT